MLLACRSVITRWLMNHPHTTHHTPTHPSSPNGRSGRGQTQQMRGLLVLSSGCESCCHGDKRMHPYLKNVGVAIPLPPPPLSYLTCLTINIRFSRFHMKAMMGATGSTTEEPHPYTHIHTHTHTHTHHYTPSTPG